MLKLETIAPSDVVYKVKSIGPSTEKTSQARTEL